jgi:hypothetical protein
MVSNPHIRELIAHNQSIVVVEFLDFDTKSTRNVTQYCENIWGEITYELKRWELHYLSKIHALIYMIRLYVTSINELVLSWLGLKFHFLVLLFPILDWRSDTFLAKERARRMWKLITALRGFHSGEDFTQLIPQDLNITYVEQPPSDFNFD